MKNLLVKYSEIIRYLIVGVLTTVVSLGSYYLLTKYLFDASKPIQLQIANIISWCLAVVFAYVCSRKFVFASKNPDILKEASSFTLSRVSTLLIDMAIMFIGVSVLKFNDRYVKLVVQVVVTISNYLFSKLFVFKKDK